jgi:hypothetical protein
MSKIYDALQHLEAQRKAQESGDTPETGSSNNPLDLQERPTTVTHPPTAPTSQTGQNLLEQAAAVTRFGAELHRRMGEVGLNGVQGIFALADQLNRALATVSQPEIDGAEADLMRVEDQIRSMKDNLRQLKAVKSDLEGLAGFVKR